MSTPPKPLWEQPPEPLEQLLGRFDARFIDLPRGEARIRLEFSRQGTVDCLLADGRKPRLDRPRGRPDAIITADPDGWRALADDLREGMAIFARGRLRVRRDLHVGIGFLAATARPQRGRLRFARVATSVGEIAYCEAGYGPTVVCIHGLGGTKASFLTTVAALAIPYRVVALDLPGFGDSAKPLRAPYDAPWFAAVVREALDALGIRSAHFVGNSMGGRVAIEIALSDPKRVRSLGLLCPSLAWLRRRQATPLVRALRPELGLLQPAPRPLAELFVRRMIPGAAGDDWVAAGVDEFLRSYCSARGRAAFYAAARNIYLEPAHGDSGFWRRLGELRTPALFVWGKRDTLVPASFHRHVRKVLPNVEQLILPCGHVPQVEDPQRTHTALVDLFRSASRATGNRSEGRSSSRRRGTGASRSDARLRASAGLR